ncbi:MAG: PQQ-dependent sugar dehydrogenase [Chloroflexi bacterium]|nr:PQQ-dependent sugar dehydrogenase [Chloroflexota bacterium]
MRARWLSLLLLLVLGMGCRRAPATTPPPTQQLPAVSPTPLATLPPPAPIASPSPVATRATAAAATPWPWATALPMDIAQRTHWRVIAQVNQPTSIVGWPGDPERLVILERAGRARLWVRGQLREEPFLDLTDRVGSAQPEQGLLGLAFHPEFATNGEFFVNYTDQQGNTVVARFTLDDPDARTADPDTEERLLYVEQPYGNHNGGHLAFGPDGYLYIGLGDGGAAGDPEDRAQNPQSLLGKMLRIDVDHGDPYAIPPDNPYADGREGRPEIWALGLRNPWRYAFDPLTGALFIADVGQNLWEEVNYWPADAPPGPNFGWDYYEGMHPYEDTPPPGLTLIFPVVEYGHDMGCSITGGEVYRGQALPELWGVYLYGDFCSGRIWGLTQTPEGQWVSTVLWETQHLISTFGRDAAGELYLADYGTGAILRLEPRE